MLIVTQNENNFSSLTEKKKKKKKMVAYELEWIASKFKLQQQKGEHSPYLTSTEIK